MRRFTCSDLLAALFALCACGPSDQPALRVGSNIWSGFEPMYVAHELGYYDPQRIKLIGFPSSVEVMRAYRNGIIDVAGLSVDEVLTVGESTPGNDSIFLIADYSKGADAIVAQASIRSMAELRGRRVGAESDALGALMLSRALALSGMRVSDVEFVPLTFDQHESAFLEGRVDAIVTFEPRRTRLLAKGAVEVFSSRQIPAEIVDVLLAPKAVLRARRDSVEHLVSGWFRGLTVLNNRAPDVVARAAHRHSLTAEQYVAAFNGIEQLDRAANRRLLAEGEIQTTLRMVRDIMLAQKLIDRPPPIEGLIDGSFVAASQ